MARFHAAALHFILNLIVGVGLLSLCWFVWYPAPMLLAIGGHEIFLLIVGIDVALGPLLTLMVFDVKKRSLKFDIFVIALIQVGAMMYGVNTLLEVRPAYVAALGDHFQVVLVSELTDANMAKANVTPPLWGPKWVGTQGPRDVYEKDQVAAMTSFGGGRGHLPQLHVPYALMVKEILQGSKLIAVLKKDNPQKTAEIDSWLHKHGYTEQAAKFQPIKISASEFVVFVDGVTAAVIGIAPFRP
ncbi:hypothetical protein [Aquabacterium sp.]|uniref:hypothetical protein n=1 Tax=Aquabacterium sp. TaxID=1872578 RepID=UPI0019A1657B|nr:hypothetical protein [Aquabacterium sp.]MBC7700268.1 hypothetical protein [Aquabacterium sp.]